MTWTLTHGDCLAGMAAMPDKSVDCVITDPPYGIRADEKQGNRAGQRHGGAFAKSTDYGDTAWDQERPSPAAVGGWLRVGRECVVFGGNYMADMLPPSPSWIAWDKDNGTNGYADFELAWTSHRRAARKVRWQWHGMLQDPRAPKEERVHPTQKPLGLMLWVVENYTERGDLVCDPYAGSGTTGVACVMLGRNFIGWEQDAKYHALATKRLEGTREQASMFEKRGPKPKQATMFGGKP